MKELARYMTEDELLTAITEAATFLGWRWHHVRRSDLALSQGHSGFPDLVLAKDGVVLFLELKAANGRMAPDQLAWLDAINGSIPTPELLAMAQTVQPHNLDDVLELLGAPRHGRHV